MTGRVESQTPEQRAKAEQHMRHYGWYLAVLTVATAVLLWLQ